MLHPSESGKSVVKSMLHEEKQDSGTRRGCSRPGGTAVLSFFCAKVMHGQTKEVTVSCSLGH